MILTKIETIDVFLSQSFADGIFFRELRLSQEEAGYVQNKFPKASVKKCPSPESIDGKCWYEINLLTAARGAIE
jgi:hypothetical protein